MSTTVIEAGPVMVTGPGTLCEEQAVTAVDCIDDPIALVGDEPVSVDELWTEVIRRAVGAPVERLIVVFPTWWTTEQLARVRQAAAAVTADVVTMRRVAALSAGLHDAWAVVEIAADLIVVSRPDTDPVTLIRDADIDTLAGLVADAAGGATEVAVDAQGEETLCRAVTSELRRRGATVSVSDTASVRCAAGMLHSKPVEPVAIGRPPSRGKRAVGGALAVAAVCAAIAVRPDAATGAGHPMSLLVEGRVGMQVPAQWRVQRVTGGPGSDRVQVVSTTDPDTVVHLTQSATSGQSVADTLRRALDEQPAGVFVDFNPDDRIAGRSVVSYREIRADREIRWAVLADRAVRIAIGCQSAPGRGDTVQGACEAAIRSAHAVF
ncbi:type VII secretion-associated protein [Mycobacterium sp. 21AC1]|uniref:type VII secretion-associated protein n=1 Tax=[Mycobacterium] appelbergii TaxID=2939269 RepID=UPI002938DDC6|nr:type VII secretion-associated protein [Mycobacterium sp. 21AC1]MDV3127474.1 type VII secretion-associated protein [Mycobacterium sp. 21AC1]